MLQSSIIRKGLNEFSLFGRIARKKPLILRFIKLHLKKTQAFWNNIVQTEETKAELFDINAH